MAVPSTETELYIDALRRAAETNQEAAAFLSQLEYEYCSPISLDFPKEPVKLKVTTADPEGSIEKEFYNSTEITKFSINISPISRLPILEVVDAREVFQDELCIKISEFLIKYNLSGSLFWLKELEEEYDTLNKDIESFIENIVQCDRTEAENPKLASLRAKQNSLQSRLTLFEEIAKKYPALDENIQVFSEGYKLVCQKKEDIQKLLTKAECCLSEKALCLEGIALIKEHTPPPPSSAPGLFFAASSKPEIPLSEAAFFSLDEKNQMQLAILIAKQHRNHFLSQEEAVSMNEIANNAYEMKGKKLIEQSSVGITLNQFNTLDEPRQKKLAILLAKQHFQEAGKEDNSSLVMLIRIAQLLEQKKICEQNNPRPRFNVG